jgi:pimeloyl-ACP methyl ester carboxylesterase
MIVIDYPDTKAPKAARTALMATILTVLSPLLITAGFILYVWTRFRGQARRSGMEDPLERTLGVRTMSEAVELLEGIPFKPKMPGPLSSAISIAMDLVPSALATTRITAGLVYPYPRAFEPIMLESQDGTPVCGHLAIQAGESGGPALVLANGGYASKNSAWLLSLALRAYYDWGFHVLAIDMRNFGDSGRFSEAPTSWGYRESDDIVAAAEYLDSLDIVSTVGVFGASMAGSAALVAAGRSRLDGPLAGGVVAAGAYAEASREVERLSGKNAPAFTGLLRRLARRALLFAKTLFDGPRAFSDPRAYTREVSCQYYEIGEVDLYRKASPLKMMSEMEVPCLLVHAKDDLRSPVGDAHQLVEAAGENPMVAAMIVPSGGHELYGPATGKWFQRTLEVFFTYWGEFGLPPEDGLGLAGIDSMNIYGNPDN